MTNPAEIAAGTKRPANWLDDFDQRMRVFIVEHFRDPNTAPHLRHVGDLLWILGIDDFEFKLAKRPKRVMVLGDIVTASKETNNVD